MKIGTYYDEVLCNIMSMDCCHILLGRPYKYNRQEMHDGRLSRYTIVANEMKQVLLLLVRDPKNENCSTLRICLVEGRKFLDGLKNKSVLCFDYEES